MVVKNQEKLYELITECKIRRLTTEESLDYIKQHGIKLSERTYRRYKKELEDKTRERILEEEKYSYSEFLRKLDTIKKVEKEYWSLFSTTKDESLKGKILHLIENLQNTSDDYFSKIYYKARRIREKIEEEKSAEVEYKRRLEEKEQLRNQEYWKRRIKDELEDEEKVAAPKTKQKTHAIAN